MTNIKLTILGKEIVGKSFLVYRFFDKKRSEEYVPTVEMKYSKTEIIDGMNTNLEIQDTAGEEDYQNLLDTWIKSANGIILVFAVNDKDSFNKLDEKYKRVRQIKGKKFPIVLIGNKIDLPNKEITMEEAKKKADEWGVPYFETSALKNTNCKEPFLHIAKVIIPKIRKATSTASSHHGVKKCPCLII